MNISQSHNPEMDARRTPELMKRDRIEQVEASARLVYEASMEAFQAAIEREILDQPDTSNAPVDPAGADLITPPSEAAAPYDSMVDMASSARQNLIGLFSDETEQ